MLLPKGKPAKKLDDIIKEAIISSFERNNRNFSATRFELGISRSTLYRHLTKYGLYKLSTNRESSKRSTP